MSDFKREPLQYEKVDFGTVNVLNQPSNKLRRTTLIATVGVNVTAVDLQKMMEAGTNVFKFKLETSTQRDKIELMAKLDEAARACCIKFGVSNWLVASCIALKTASTRSGIVQEDVELKEGSTVILTCNVAEYDKCNEARIFIDLPSLSTDVTVGMEINFENGKIVMECTKIVDKQSIKCLITKGGTLVSLCNVCFRGITHKKTITKKDFEIMTFAMDNNVDIIQINYVRTIQIINKAKMFMKDRPKLILSSICTMEGLMNIDDLLKESDGIILNRDILPYELPKPMMHRMPQIQKWLGAKCKQHGKPFFLQGGIFQNMIESGKFISGGESDVTNAILDGATGFILHDSSDMEWTMTAIKALNNTCSYVETFTCGTAEFWRTMLEVKMPVNAAEAAMISCCAAAIQTQAHVIILPTVTGKTARILMWMRPHCLIITISTCPNVTKQMYMLRGVAPLIYTAGHDPKMFWWQNIQARINFAVEYAVKRGWVIYGDMYVTLQRGTESSSFCDTVRTWMVTLTKKPRVQVVWIYLRAVHPEQRRLKILAMRRWALQCPPGFAITLPWESAAKQIAVFHRCVEVFKADLGSTFAGFGCGQEQFYHLLNNVLN